MAKHASLCHLLLLFILISAVGCYSAFGKQLPDEEGLSKLKMTTRNLGEIRGGDGTDSDNESSDSESNDQVDFDPDVSVDPFVLYSLGTIFRTRQYSLQIVEETRQMCKGTKCVDDTACNDVGKTPEGTPICGGCDVNAEKCTFNEAETENEVLPEVESKEDNTEATEIEVLPKTTEDNTQTTEDTNQL